MNLLLGILMIIFLLLLVMGLGLLVRWLFFKGKKGVSFLKSIEEVQIYIRKNNK